MNGKYQVDFGHFTQFSFQKITKFHQYSTQFICLKFRILGMPFMLRNVYYWITHRHKGGGGGGREWAKIGPDDISAWDWN